MKNNLEPRAKIGDVVIVNYENSIFQCTILTAMFQTYDDGSASEWIYEVADDEDIELLDSSILKNLTTNISYE